MILKEILKALPNVKIDTSIEKNLIKDSLHKIFKIKMRIII